ncbi:Ribokinase-like protein [Gymnopilus junonius]|uniref:Ribokinase-like protein n=1 Tax=Gymnopilus junonius TaxID=109634 RepID=A0A9P5TJ94_GYMJU|nr:Ribokinase-like protein [Gymnopilus junonius]
MADNQCTCTVRGSIMQHIVRPGETLSSHAHESRVGGKGANQAVAIARAGGQTRFFGSIGRDGVWIRDKVAGYGIDVGGLIVVEEPTGRAIIQVDEKGENSIILFPGANFSELHEERFTKHGEGWFPETTHLLLQNEIPLRSTLYALQNAKNATLDWLIVNESEAQELYQAAAGSRAKPLSSMTTKELLFHLSAEPAFEGTNVVCTLGAEGVLAFDAPSALYQPAAKLVHGVRDTTGAGDSGLMEFGPRAHVGREITEDGVARILKTCVHAAGMCVEKRGTIDSIPSRAEVEERMLIRS